jgi:hypothetical protein
MDDDAKYDELRKQIIRAGQKIVSGEVGLNLSELYAISLEMHDKTMQEILEAFQE